MSDDHLPLQSRTRPRESAPGQRLRSTVRTYASTLVVVLVTLGVIILGSPGTRRFEPATPVASPVPAPTTAPLQPTATSAPTLPEPSAAIDPTQVASGTYPVPDEQVPILMYHYIRPDPGPDDPIGQGLSVSPELFAEHLAFLADGGYTPITMARLADIWDGREPMPPMPVVLTFDDGYRDFYTNAWPLLRQYGFPATVYVITGVIDQPAYLTREMIQELDASGLVDFGSHTVYHFSLPAVSAADAEAEIVESKRDLEALLGHPVRSFCYPTGAYGDREAALVSGAGYSLAVTTDWDYAHPSMDRTMLPRIRIGAWTTAYELEMWL